jgi:hypothetical protein
VFDAQSAVDSALAALKAGRDAKGTTNKLIHEAIRERRCKDNCTIMLIKFERLEQEAEAAGKEVPATAAAAAREGKPGAEAAARECQD